MRINFHKNELIPVGKDNEDINQFVDIFGCKLDTFPITSRVLMRCNRVLKDDEMYQ